MAWTAKPAGAEGLYSSRAFEEGGTRKHIPLVPASAICRKSSFPWPFPGSRSAFRAVSGCWLAVCSYVARQCANRMLTTLGTLPQRPCDRPQPDSHFLCDGLQRTPLLPQLGYLFPVKDLLRPMGWKVPARPTVNSLPDLASLMVSPVALFPAWLRSTESAAARTQQPHLTLGV